MAYELINWKDFPNEETPLSSFNLNHMDTQIKRNADDIEEQNKNIEELHKDIIPMEKSTINGESEIDGAEGNIQSITFYGNTEKVNDTLVTPQGKVESYGKNILNATMPTTTAGNVTFTNNGNGTYTLNSSGTVTQANVSPNGGALISLKNKTYKFIVSNTDKVRARVVEDINGARTEKVIGSREVTFTATSNAKYILQIWTNNNETYIIQKPLK